MFYFATPEETPAMMTTLVDWFKAEFEAKKKHPLIVAIEFHYKFVRIHPFDDGNGRMARLLMNFILMKYDYPPVIVLTQDKEAYIQALHKGDQEDDFEPFAVFVAECLIQSQELMLKAAKGESIDDPEDLDKKIRLLQKRLEKQEELRETKNVDSILKVIENTFTDYFNKKIFIETISKFESLFSNLNKEADLVNKGKEYSLDLYNETIIHNSEEILWGEVIGTKDIVYLVIRYNLNGFKYVGVNAFDVLLDLKLVFLEYKYKFTCFLNGGKIKAYEKPYHQPISNEEVDQIAKQVADQILLEIEQKTNLNET